MNYIIAGSRSITYYPLLEAVMRTIKLQDWPTPTKIICGCAIGSDRLGFDWARANGIPVEFFPAWSFQSEWAFYVTRKEEIIHECPPSSFGKRAGFVRNGYMAHEAAKDKPGCCVLLHDGISKGTLNMKSQAEEFGLKVFVGAIK